MNAIHRPFPILSPLTHIKTRFEHEKHKRNQPEHPCSNNGTVPPPLGHDNTGRYQHQEGDDPTEDAHGDVTCKVVDDTVVEIEDEEDVPNQEVDEGGRINEVEEPDGGGSGTEHTTHTSHNDHGQKDDRPLS